MGSAAGLVAVVLWLRSLNCAVERVNLRLPQQYVERLLTELDCLSTRMPWNQLARCRVVCAMITPRVLRLKTRC
jgi:hypothetical protein